MRIRFGLNYCVLRLFSSTSPEKSQQISLKNIIKAIISLTIFVSKIIISFPPIFIIIIIKKDKQHETLFFKLQKFSSITTPNSSNSSNNNNNKIQTIAEVFSILETNKHLLNIESYLLSETTLEQIFMSFAKNAHSTPFNNFSRRDSRNDDDDGGDSRSVVTTAAQTSCNTAVSRESSGGQSLSFCGDTFEIGGCGGTEEEGFFKRLKRRLRLGGRAGEYEVKF